MDFINNLTNNSILIIPSNIKEKLLNYIDQNNILIDIKLMSFNDLKKGLLFDYTDEAIYYLMNNYKISYDTAKEYIANIYYLENKDYEKNSKLYNLLLMKEKLEENNLLIKDNLFINLLESKDNIYVYGFDYITKYNNYLLELAKSYINIQIINKVYNDYKHIVYSIDTISNEVAFVVENIAKLIDQGVSLNNIYIANYSDEYYFAFNKTFKEYNIPFNIKDETTLKNTTIGKYFINNLSNDIEELLSDIKQKFNIDHNNYNSNVYSKLIKLLNTLNWTNDYKSIKDIIINKMSDITIPSNHYKYEIKTTDIIDNIFSDDEYVFLIGFNLGVLPITKKDEDYITDNIKPSFLEDTVTFNIESKSSLLKAIRNIKNLYITYKEVSTFNNYFPSYLIDKDYLKEEKVTNTYSSYSDDYNKVLYVNKIDKLIKFGEKDELLSTLNNNYSIEYNSYDNTFKGINNTKLIHELKSLRKSYKKDENNETIETMVPKHTYSYSNISTYYKCPFKFYLDNFFRLNDYEQTLDAFIGSLFHEVLDKCINSDQDIDEVYDNFIEKNKSKRDFTPKDYYFLEQLRDEIHFIINVIKEQYTHCSYTNETHETKVELSTTELELDTSYEAIIKGYVDKIRYNDDSLVIEDYKTGSSDKIDPRYFEFGLYIQLPIYLYLLKHDNRFKDKTIVGLYLQHILTSLPTRDKKKTLEEIKINNLKLDGITLKDETKLKEFDGSYESSLVVQSLKILKKDGSFPKGERFVDYDKQEELINNIKEILKKCINNVAEGNFDIKPISVSGKVNGCDYCSYKDICYRRKEQYNIQYVKVNEEGSESNE